MKYVKKPVVVEAFQFGVDEKPDWFIQTSHYDRRDHCLIPTEHARDGFIRAERGDMIIKGIQGEIYPCKKDIFDTSYEPYNEEQKDETMR